MAGPLEPRIDITTSKIGSFKSSKKALNAPLIFLVGGIFVNGKSPGDYMWSDGYDSMTDYNIYNVFKTNLDPTDTKAVDKSTIQKGWEDCTRILSLYKINPSKKILVAFSKGCEGFNHAIAKAGGISNFDLVLIAGVWSNSKSGAVAGGIGIVAGAIQSAPQKCYYFNSGNDGTVFGLDKIKNVCAPGHYIEWNGGHQAQIKKTANWIKDNVTVSSTGEAATPSGAATSTGTGGTPNPTPTGSGTGTSAGTGGTATPTKKTVTTTTLQTTGPGWLKPGNIVADEKGLKFLKQYEGIRYQVYDDKGGKIISDYSQARGYPTIGIGHLIGAGERDFYSKYLGGREKMTEAEVLALKKKDIPRFAKPLNDRLKEPVTQNMFNAMLSLGFNTGMNGGAIKKAIAAVNAKDYEGAANAIKDGPKTSKGVVMEGLRKRRNAEYEMFKEGMPSSQPTAQNTSGPSETVTSEVVEENGTNAQVATASNDCNDLQKEDAKLKSNESPEGAKEEEVTKDPLPPPKDETPISIDGKYNHRFYILPTKENKPLPLADMVSDKKKYAKRCWAWRTDEGSGYGYKENEYKLTTTDGKSLVSGLVPYWPAYSGSLEPGSGSFDIDKLEKPKVNGSWKQLLEGQKQIQSFLDVPILLNAYDVGVYNDNIGYVFEAGNELHMTILEKVFLTNKGSQIGIGNAVNTTITDKKNQDSSWREWPKWSGIWVSHCLKNSGYSLYADINVNINTYHEKVLSAGKLINYPGNKEWKWKDLKAAGMQDLVFKPSKIWYDTVNLNSDELLKDSGDIAIFIVDYHIKKDGTLTERGQKLLDKIISLNWKLGVVSAVKSHTAQSNQLYAEVLVYLDKTGKMVTFGGNTTPRGADSIPGGGPYHIAIKETNFKDFAILAGDNWINGAVFISNVKSAPEGHRVGGLDSKIYTTDIFKDYYKRVDNEKGKLTGRMYNFLLPYIDQKPAAPAPKPAEKTLEETNFTPSPLTNAGNDPGSGEQLMGSVKELIAKGLLRKMETYKNSTSEAGQAYPGLLTGGPWNSFHAMSAESVKAGVGAITTGHDAFRTYADQYSKWVNAGGSKSPPWKGPTDKNATPGGSFHGKGRAVDISGTAGVGTLKKQNLDKYREKMSPLQKFAFKYGIPFGWYNYYNEVWHFNYKHDKTTPAKNISLWTKGG